MVDAHAAAQGARDAARLAGLLLLLLLAAFGTVVAFVLFVPEVNDYHRASVTKHARLEALPSPKIVLAGGSNLAFGIDSPLLESQTGIPVVNMGMDGFLGVEFLLREVESELEPGDLVVVAIEYDSYILPVEGIPENQFAIVKRNPRTLRYLSAVQRLRLARSFVGIAHAKAGRLLDDALQGILEALTGIENPWRMAEHIGRSEGFNSNGDFTSHLDIRFPAPPEWGMDLDSKPNAPVTTILHDFNRRMHARGVRVLFSYPPITERYFATYVGALERIHRDLIASQDVIAPSPPSAFVQPESVFFDTVYHLNRAGREVRTRKLATDINAVLATDTSH